MKLINILTNLINLLFSIDIQKEGFFLKYIIKFFGLKFSFKFQSYINLIGENNNIYIKKNDILISVKKIKGMKIFIEGNNNTVIIEEPYIINNCFITCKGNNNKIIIEKTIYWINNLNINLFQKDNIDNRLIHIKKNISTEGVQIFGWSNNSKIIIGEDCQLSFDVSIISGDGHLITNKNGECTHNYGFVEIGDHVWIGMRSTICKNIKIPNNCIVGACSVVTKSFFKKNCIIAGNPAKIIKTDMCWSRKNNW